MRHLHLSAWVLSQVLFSVSSVALGIHIPDRPHNAMSGSEFLKSTYGMSGPKREQAIAQAIKHGNVPTSSRKEVLVPLEMTTKAGYTIRAQVAVSCGFLAIGSDEDFIDIPMNFRTASNLSRELGFTLPTRRLVESIAKHSSIVLGKPRRHGPKMVSSESYLLYQMSLREQLRSIPADHLVAGYKKNIVLSNRLLQKPGAIAIFGWKNKYGKWIQSVSTRHKDSYVDYSHAVRMVGETVWVEGKAWSIYDIALDPVLHKLVSDEGPIDLKSLLSKDSKRLWL